MFKRIKLTNFQRHAALEVTLGEGLVAIKGANEAGKSTLLRALAYLCFGAKALAAPLAETVTWGEPVSTLRVEGDIEVEGVLYEIMRGDSGAQLDYPGGCVTGQREVTAFICKLLGMEAAAAPHLILSNQTEIRGALEEGPAATAKLIEKLANFEQIDELLETMQEELTLGSPVAAVAALAAANEALNAANDAAIEPDTAALQEQIDHARDAFSRAELTLKRCTDTLEAAGVAYNDARVKAAERNAAVARVDALSTKVQSLATRIDEAAAVEAPERAEERVQALQAELTVAAQAHETRVVYESVKGFLVAPAQPVWAGSKETLDQAVLDHAEKLADDEKEVVRLKGELKTLNAVYLAGTCTFCGKDFSGVPEVAERNAETRTKIEDATIASQNLERANVKLRETLDTLRAVQARCAKPLAALAKHGAVLALADDLMPPQLKWIGPDVDGDQLNVSGHTTKIAGIQREVRAYHVAKAVLETLVVESMTAREALAAEKAALDELPELDLATLQSEQRTAAVIGDAALESSLAASERLRAAEEERTRALDLYRSALERQAVAKAAVKARQEEIETLAFNNELLKRVRAARPIVSDRLWGIVLAAVSKYFSDMRGVRSVVTKDRDGFKVDGHAVATLSGSTLDVLGLAIRVALVRTFLPAAQFLVLDEPGAGCDEARTVNLLAFVAACGFKQVLLVTHEAVSEEFCNNLVQL